MYRGGQGGSHGRTSTWKGEGSGGRARDYGHGESKRRRSRERRRSRSRSRSRSSSRDNSGGSRHRERRRQRNRDRESSSSSSSSSSNNSLERPSKTWSSSRTTEANPTNSAKVDVADRSFENKYNYEYKPPSGIFEESELQTRYSSGVNMEAPVVSRIDTLAGSSEIGINPPMPGNMESRPNNYGNFQGPVSGGISMKLQAPVKEQTGTSLSRVIAPISAKVPIFSRPSKLVSPMVPTLPSKSAKIASVFNIDDDDEPEEMPPECKMRMKNVGRDTPTSAGPNSFGKTKIGFCNVTHIAEKKLEGTLAPPKKK